MRMGKIMENYNGTGVLMTKKQDLYIIRRRFIPSTISSVILSLLNHRNNTGSLHSMPSKCERIPDATLRCCLYIPILFLLLDKDVSTRISAFGRWDWHQVKPSVHPFFFVCLFFCGVQSM